MLNWDTQENSGVVDRWEIYRCVVNNFAASRLNLKNPDEYKNLNFFQLFRTIHRESSRFSSVVQDSINQNTKTNLITGQHYFMDTQVSFGNTYFYSIRAISPEGNASPFSYKGVKLTSAVFEQKWVTVLTDFEKAQLSQNFVPLIINTGRRPTSKSTLSLQPEYSKSDWTRIEPRVNYEVK